MRILHVEDDEDTRKLVECILHGKGWQVVSVENATSAFKLAACRRVRSLSDRQLD